MEEEIKETTEAEDLIDTLADGVVAIDKESRIISFSEGAEHITGFTLDEVIGKQCADVFESDMCGEDCPVKISINSGEIVSNWQFHILTKDKRRIPIAVSSSPFKNAKGEIIGAIQIFRNVAEVKFLTQEVFQEKNKLQAILDSIADGVFTVDRDWKVTSFNKSAEKITGTSSEKALGKRCFEVFKSSVCQKGCPLQKTLKTGKPISGYEIEILTKGNQRLPVSVSTALLKDKEDKIIGGVETFRDLSKIKQLTEELKERYSFQNVVGKNPKMQEIYELIQKTSESKATVIIQGESGTGKELIARAIHYNSPRHNKPFIKVNCGALPESLLESELFGHVKGAFTDAITNRKGRFELANQGTLFLDEIGEASPGVQVKLLRVLETGEFEPVGSSKSLKVDVRIITATNQNLKQRIKEGKFREDLYYRLNVLPVFLPPLRERNDDIPLLVEHFLKKFNQKTGKRITSVSPEAIDLLLDYPWPGNVRELENAIEHSFVHCQNSTILPNHLPDEPQNFPNLRDETSLLPPALERGNILVPQQYPSRAVEKILSPEKPLKQAEKEIILQALKKNKGNKIKTAKELKISRSTLWRKMKGLKVGL